jgi:hypothetical protein
MKSIALILLGTILSFNLLAQAPPEAFNYSGAARDAAGNPISEKTIGVELSILKGSPSGAVQYRERHFVNTDKFGVFNCNVGQGAVQQGAFSNIEWFNDSYYLRVGFDANGGTNFVVLGTTQLLSVPYALYAKTAGSISSMSGDLKPVVELNELRSFYKIDNDLRFRASAVVFSEGSSPVTDRGFVWANTSNPTISNNKLSIGSGAGTFEANVSGITGQQSFVRAFATNAGGTKYSDRQYQLTSLLPEVRTNKLEFMANNAAICEFTISSDGGSDLNTIGVCWSTNPDFPNDESGTCGTVSTVSTGTFTKTLTNLQNNTTYYVRAYAVNDFGSTYGNQLILNVPAFNPNEVFGTYIGDQVVSDPFLLNVFTTIDPDFPGSFKDTLTVVSVNANGVARLRSTLFNNQIIEADLSKSTGGNVTAQNIGTWTIFPDAMFNNTTIKSSSSLRITGIAALTARYNMSTTLDLGGSPLSLPNISTTGTYLRQ